MSALLLLLSSSSSEGGTLTAVAPAATASLVGERDFLGHSPLVAVAPAAQASLVGAGTAVTGTATASAPRPRAAVLGTSEIVDPATSAVVAATGWQVRAVTQAGVLVNLVKASVGRVSRGVRGREEAELTLAVNHPDADVLDVFSHEVQLWLDGELYAWLRPATLDASVDDRSNVLRVRCLGLFSYFHDEVVGGEKVNHITSPHEDSAAVGAVPASWTITSGVEDAAIVDNNAEFWQTPVAIQLNNSEAGEDAFGYQRFTVPPELDRVPFAAMATVYIADNQGGAPTYGGAAYNRRGLMIQRLDGSGNELSQPKVAVITDETPRNQVVRLQTEELLPLAGQQIDVRIYAPDAFVVWRFVGLYDGRAVKADRIDKTEAFRMLVEHAQDTSLGKQDHGITIAIWPIGEPTSREWPWWRRDVIGEQLEDLADTFEFHVSVTETTRELRVKRQVGTTRAVTLTKEDFHAWGLGIELGNAYSRVIRQGDGSGIARDEVWVSDPDALRGNVREMLDFAPPGEGLAQLRDQAEVQLDRVRNVSKLPRATISGYWAKELQPGDTVSFNIDHGWAQWTGQARCMQIDFDGVSRTAQLHLEPA